MKKTIFFSAFLLGTFLILAITGFYPAAAVNGSLVTYRAWRKVEEASKRFASVELARRGGKPLDFAAAQNAGLLLEGRKEILAALIEDAIIIREGRRREENFDQKSEAYVANALRQAPNLKKAVESLYGIPYGDFEKLVLLPQARRDILREDLAKEGINFEEWLREARIRAKVWLFFTPSLRTRAGFTGFRWNGDKVE